MQVASGDLAAVQSDFATRVKRLTIGSGDEETAKIQAAKEISNLKWGPTNIRVYNLIGLGIQLFPGIRDQQLDVARWLSIVAKVDVDGADTSGTTALFHAISTHPTFEPALAQILYDAGAEVNARNRYGANAAHEICMLSNSDKEGLKMTEEALRWFVTHGGNIDVKDSDKCTPRTVLGLTTGMIGLRDRARILKVVEEEDGRRQGRKGVCCVFCGREDAKKLLQCGRCRKAGYCEPLSRQCQKLDWPRHKTECKAS